MTIDNELLVGGLVGIGEKDTDFTCGADDFLLELNAQGDIDRQIVYTYNQAAQPETAYWCTIYSAITEVSWLLNRQFTINEILEIGRQMIKDGELDPKSGAYLGSSINYVMKWVNGNLPQKIKYYRIDYLDDALNNILTHVHPRPTQIGYRTSTELFQELESTGVAMKSIYPLGGGHAVTQWGYNTYDNYNGRKKHNSYSFDKIQDLIKNNVIYRFGYCFLKQN